VSSTPFATPPKSLLVVRLGAMGDIIHTLAAVTALRTALPDLRLGWVIEDRWSELLLARNTPRSGPRTAQRPVADFVHIVDTKRWRKSAFSGETRAKIKSALREIRNQNYELAADFQGALKSALVARLAGARTVTGFAHPRELPAHFFYKQFVETTDLHVIDQYRRIAEFIAGVALHSGSPQLPHDQDAEANIAAKMADTKDFVLINPGAGWGAKQWPAERYGEVAQSLAAGGLLPIINFGPGEEELALKVQEASCGVAQPISCSVAELIALTRRAKLFIGGDTGPLHLAAALKIPVVAIFGPTDPARNGPFGTRSIVLRDPASRTSLSHTNSPDPALLNITAAEVISSARRLLETSVA